MSCNWFNTMVAEMSVIQLKDISKLSNMHNTTQMREMEELTKDNWQRHYAHLQNTFFYSRGLHLFQLMILLYISLWLSGTRDFWMLLPEPVPPSNEIQSHLQQAQPPLCSDISEQDSPTERVLCLPALLGLDPPHHLKGEFPTFWKLLGTLTSVSALWEAG